MLSVLKFAHSLLEQTIQSGDHVIDGTVGNGHDTVFLAKLVGPHGHVYGFDIQKTAIINTSLRLKEQQLEQCVTLFQHSHEQVIDWLPKASSEKIKAAIFNLGYLPGGDKSIVTKPSSTIKAAQSIFNLLQVGGIIVLVIYPGHEEGRKEKDYVLSYVKTIDQQLANVLKYEFINQVNEPPFVIGIEKR